jgi:hypothetical protein
VRLQKAGERDAAHDLFDAHLPLMRYEQRRAPVSPYASTSSSCAEPSCRTPSASPPFRYRLSPAPT